MLRGDSLQGLTLAVLAICILAGCSSFKLTGQSQDSGFKDVHPKFVSCMYNGSTPMIDDVPDPNVCTIFHSCHIQSGPDPDPTLRVCQDGHDGTPLYYDFLNCKCEEKEIATCYNENNVTHKQNQFICAKPYDGSFD